VHFFLRGLNLLAVDLDMNASPFGAAASLPIVFVALVADLPASAALAKAKRD
jgi:hypothetical protein